MTLRDVEDPTEAARRRDRALAKAEERMAEASAAAMRQFLRKLQQSVTPESLTAASGSQVPKPTHLFTLGQAAGWWEDAIDEHVTDAVQGAWQSGYLDTRDGELLRTSLSGADDYLGRVKDRLSRRATPTIPEQAMDIARVALSDETARGSDIATTSRRLAAEFGWDEDAAFWRDRMGELDSEADAILDRIGPPGHPEREAVRTGRVKDETLARIQDQRAEARKHIDDVESTWQTRSERIARTETTGAYNAGSVQAAHDEGAGVKIWLATGDARTRDEHLDASGQCVPVDDDFNVGGEQLAMPGDPVGPPELTINCRCTMVFASSCEEGARFDDAQEPIETEREDRGLAPREERSRQDAPVAAEDVEAPVAAPAEFGTTMDANTWGEEKYGHLRDEITRDEHLALRTYSRNEYKNINGSLRGIVDLDEDVQAQVDKYTQDLDSIMDKAGGIPEPVRAYRGVGPDAVQQLADESGDLTGASFQDRGFMSTALNSDESEFFSGKPGSAVFELDVPEGTRGVYVDAVTEMRSVAGRDLGESELLLGRNHRIVVDEATDRVNDEGARIWRAHIEAGE